MFFSILRSSAKRPRLFPSVELEQKMSPGCKRRLFYIISCVSRSALIGPENQRLLAT